jgi:hypothetical protein
MATHRKPRMTPLPSSIGASCAPVALLRAWASMPVDEPPPAPPARTPTERAAPGVTRAISDATAAALAYDAPARWLTLADLVRAWGVSGRTIITRFVRQQGLPALKLGNGWRFRAVDVAAFEAMMFKRHRDDAG